VKALVKERPAPGEVSYRDWPDPEVGPSDVLVAVRRAGLCGTDLSMYEWNRTITAGYKPELPLVMGHEFAGELAEVGGEATGVRSGDRVIVNPTLTCGACRFCRDGRSCCAPTVR
jgi:threonine 3-dehydrogenase